MADYVSILKKVIGDFLPLKCDMISELRIISEFDDMEERSDLNAHFRVMYDEQYRIALKFGGIRQFHIPDIAGGCMQFGELFIESVKDHGLEGISYEVGDELNGYHFYCRDIEVESVSRLDRGGEELIIWPGNQAESIN